MPLQTQKNSELLKILRSLREKFLLQLKADVQKIIKFTLKLSAMTENEILMQ
jgi:hypothetical protein